MSCLYFLNSGGLMMQITEIIFNQAHVGHSSQDILKNITSLTNEDKLALLPHKKRYDQKKTEMRDIQVLLDSAYWIVLKHVITATNENNLTYLSQKQAWCEVGERDIPKQAMS